MSMTKNKTTKEKEASGFDYPTFEQEAIAGLTAGKGLIGTEGVLTGMIGRLLSAAFEGERLPTWGRNPGLGTGAMATPTRPYGRPWAPYR